ncbi:MAG TPA: SIMPL domain-containing protein [Acidimicrobiales bacterium]|nr:SIMPL domain-containing protein [Acidimicrobiales bacterium]
MDPGRITVRGTGIVLARPDRLRLAFTVTSVSRSIAEALADVTGRTGALVAVLDELAVPAPARSTTGLTVARELAWEDGRQLDRGYRASHVLHLRLAEAAGVGELVRRAVEASAAWVVGPAWAVGPDNPAHAEACRLAAEDARRRAEAFAATLGARLGPLVSAAEPATRPAGGDVPFTPMRAVAAGTAQADIDVQPGEMEVTATLDASFALDL